MIVRLDRRVLLARLFRVSTGTVGCRGHDKYFFIHDIATYRSIMINNVQRVRVTKENFRGLLGVYIGGCGRRIHAGEHARKIPRLRAQK